MKSFLFFLLGFVLGVLFAVQAVDFGKEMAGKYRMVRTIQVDIAGSGDEGVRRVW